MNRRLMITGSMKTIGLAAVVGPSALLTVGCGKQVLSAANLVVDVITEIQPVLKDLVPSSVDLIAKSLTIAKQLRDALKGNDNTTALSLLQQFIAPNGLFNQILDTIGTIQDPTRRKVISGIFALAGISLRLIAARLEPAPPKGVSGVMSTASNEDRLEHAAKLLRF